MTAQVAHFICVAFFAYLALTLLLISFQPEKHKTGLYWFLFGLVMALVAAAAAAS